MNRPNFVRWSQKFPILACTPVFNILGTRNRKDFENVLSCYAVECSEDKAICHRLMNGAEHVGVDIIRIEEDRWTFLQ